MPDSYFSGDRDKSLDLRTVLSGVVEIMNYNFFMEHDRLLDLQKFYEELAYEIYHMRLRNYEYGLEVIQPEISMIADRIYLYSNLYLEKDVPELNMMIFKVFVETLNLVLAVGLKHDLALRGFAGPDKGVRMVASSGIATRVKAKDGMILTDMLKVFSFDQIFPDEIDQKFAPALNFTSYHSGHFFRAGSKLREISAIGIYFPAKIESSPFAEVAIYSDMLTETNFGDLMGYSCNWLNWAENHPDKFQVEEIFDSIDEQAGNEGNIFSTMWQSFRDNGIRKQKIENRRTGEI